MLKKEGQHLNKIKEYEEKISKLTQSVDNEKDEQKIKGNRMEYLKLENQKFNETIKKLVKFWIELKNFYDKF